MIGSENEVPREGVAPPGCSLTGGGGSNAMISGESEDATVRSVEGVEDAGMVARALLANDAALADAGRIAATELRREEDACASRMAD